MNQEMDTALASETESDPSHATPTKKKKKKKKRKKDKKFQPNFDLPGVYKVVLSELAQKALGCNVGVNVTVEKPWINIDKEAILDNIEEQAEMSEFEHMKEAVVLFPEEKLLMGYVPDESKDYDEFMICVTLEARAQVEEIIEKLKKIQEHRLNNAVNRKIKRWRSLGSEKEIEETRVKYSRPLLEVEVESKYPILPFKVQFKHVKAQDLRDGYMELRPSEETPTIFKKRIDSAIQVAPKTITNEAQTTCTYPRNAFTQYNYQLPEVEANEGKVQELLSKKLDEVLDALSVNATINLYSNDYEDLVRDEKYTLKVVMPEPQEYYCFIDMNLSGNKMISNVAWHPMWTGCIVASYVETAPSLYLTTKSQTDLVSAAIYDTNPILFWSFDDNIKPKLRLETPRPIYTLSCCPYDPNIIIGGGNNGQLVIWDITNKLSNVETEEILTVDQQNYRNYMFQLMSWMKNIYDVALVRPTALSNLQYSHRGCVNHISWMSPFHSVNKTGNVHEVSTQSMTFLTSAEDGTILIWDLLKKPTVEPGGFKAVRKFKRLKKKPSALRVMESDFRILHMNLKPVYRINLTGNARLISIASCFTNFFTTVYRDASLQSRKNLKLSDRIIFEPILEKENCHLRKTFHVGTMEGDYIQGAWDGQEFDSGEMVNFEDAVKINHGKYHDGPVVAISYCEAFDTILTVGGKIFALWKESFKNKPILWRKSTNIYTSGCWLLFESSTLKLTRMDGYEEFWTLYYQSKTPLLVRLMSNGAVSSISIHPRKIKNDVTALCDYRGSLRLFCSKHISPLIVESKKEAMKKFIEVEIERKKLFLSGQCEWNERHRLVEEKVEQQAQEVVSQKSARSKEKKEKVVNISPGLRYMESVQEKNKANAQERIKKIILMKKQLDCDDLIKKREPLRKLEEENENKKKKQRTKLKTAHKIFEDQVSMLFPDVVQIKPEPPPDPYEENFDDNYKKNNLGFFKDVAMTAQDFVEENPYQEMFNWKRVLNEGRDRRKKLDSSVDKENHKLRLIGEKEEKEKLKPPPEVDMVSRASRVSQDESIAVDAQSFISEMSKTVPLM